ncbi:MAG TPA: ComF family protein [Candidatus Dormibacteraeota bacterium]|nr:ComF family protein [Candidatus Dormibacteraeota bacterium]
MAVARPSIASEGTSSVVEQAWFRRAAEGLFSVLFPSDCRICGLPLLNISRLPVCPDCLGDIQPVRGKTCSICGERVLSVYAEYADDGLRRCPVCRRVDHPFERAVSYGSYDGGLRELIHLLKYNGVRPAAEVLGRMLAEALISLDRSLPQENVLVIPVPLYTGKRRQRGFNQAELIARAAVKVCAQRERFHLASDILLRTRDTHSQIGLTSHQRRENLRGAFAVARATAVTGRAVLLVDDVYTTGTTASECARVLRRAGASQVWVATVARTLKLASKYVDLGETDGPEPGFKVSEFQGFKGETELLESKDLETLKP